MAGDQTQALYALADPLMNFHVGKLPDLGLKNCLQGEAGERDQDSARDG